MLTLSPDLEALVQARAISTGKAPEEVIREALAFAAVNTVAADRSGIDHAGLANLLAELDAMQVRDRRSQKAITDEGWIL